MSRRAWIPESDHEAMLSGRGQHPEDVGEHQPARSAGGVRLDRRETKKQLLAPVAQLDRASGFEPEGREFESLRARHFP